MCRAGRAAESIAFFERSIAVSPAPAHVILNRLWLAIAHHRLGESDEAARCHASAILSMDAWGDSMPTDAAAQGLHLHDWLEAHVLRNEADLLLSGEGANDSPVPR